MTTLFHDKRLFNILAANILSSTGSGITMVAIPWILVTSDGGEELFGYIVLLMTTVLFLIAPYVGLIVDRFSRKGILLASQLIGFFVVGTISLRGLFGMGYDTYHLIILFASGTIYYALFYPTMFAFNQEIFNKSQYKSLNGVMEVQSQVSTMLAGGIASLLISKIDLSWILLIDALSYLSAFTIMMFIPYIKTNQSIQKESFWQRLTEGYRYMKQYPLLFLFFIAAYMPFISVMVTNYLFPIYIADILQAEAEVWGAAEASYAIGALLAGIFIPVVMQRLSSHMTVVITVFLYTISIVSVFFFPIISVFLLLKILLGFGNAGSRVARNTIMMEWIPNDKIGRVNSLFQAIGLGFRISLIGLFTKTMTHLGVSFSLGVLSLLMILAVVGILYSIRIFQGMAVEKRLPI